MKFEQKRTGIGTGAIVAAVIVVILIAGAAYFIFVPGTNNSTTSSTTSTTSTTSTPPTTTTSTGQTTTTNSSSGAVVDITIPSGVGSNMSLNFQPSTLTVAPGTTVVFINQDTGSIHNIDFNSVPSGVTITTSPNTNTWTNAMWNVTLTTAGTYQFKCDYHPWMNGTITVSGTGMTTTSSTVNSTTTTSTSTTTTSSTTTSTSNSSTTAAGATVTMPQGAGSGKNFVPSTFTVVVGVNNTITFVDADTIAPHNVYFTSVPTGATNPNPSAGPPTMVKGDTYTVTLTTPGTYDYECQFHASWMLGVITVVAAPT